MIGEKGADMIKKFWIHKTDAEIEENLQDFTYENATISWNRFVNECSTTNQTYKI